MKKMTFKQKRCWYSIPIVSAALTACGTAHAANTVDKLIKGGTTQQLDDQTNWSLGTVPTSANDVLVTTPYPPATNLTFSLGSSTNASGNVTWGTYNDTDSTGYFNYIIGSTLNTSSYTLNIGAGTNSYSPVSSSDLIYTTQGSDTVFRSGSAAANSAYGALTVNFLKSGNLDITGLTESTAAWNGAAGVVLTKTGTNGLELLNYNQTFQGSWNLSAGILEVEDGAGLGIAQTGVTQLTFTGSSTLQFGNNSTGSSALASNQVIAINSGATATIDTQTYTVADGAPINNGINGSGGSLVKISAGTLILNGACNYSGSTTVSAGTLQLNATNSYGGATNVSSGATLALGVNGTLPATTTLNLTGANFTLAALYNVSTGAVGTNLLGGSSNISAPSFNTAAGTLALGALNRSIPAVVDFTPPTGLTGSVGSITTTTANANFSGGQPTILGGWATANSQTTWAVSAGTGSVAGAISALPQSAYDQTFNVPGADVDVTSSSNSTPTVTSINSLRFATGNSVALTINSSLSIATGGILQTSNAGSALNIISGGTLTSGNGTELIVTQANSNSILLISSTITNSNVSIGLTKSGNGTVLLAGTNTFTGPTNVVGSGLVLDNQLALQNSTLAAGTVQFEQGITNFSIGGLGTSSNISLLDTGTTPIVLTFGENNANTIFTGALLGPGASVIKVGTGTTYFNDANSTFSGGFNISAGTVEFATGSSFGANQNAPGGSPVTIAGGAAVWDNITGLLSSANFGYNRGFTLGPGLASIQVGNINNATNTSTSALVLGQAGNSSSGQLVAPPSGLGALQKTGLGSLTLGYNNTYNGGTNVAEGTLISQSDNSFGVYPTIAGYTGSGPLAIVPTQTFAAVDFQDPSPQISSLTNYVNGNASAGTASIVLGAVNVSTGLSIGADNTSTTFSGNISDLTANYSTAVGSIIKVGTGVLTLSGTDTFTGGVNVSSGGLALGSATAMPANSNLSIGASATVTAMNVGTGAYALKLNTLSNSGLIDLTRNDLIIHTGTTISAATAMVSQGYNGSAWNGTTGITSSTAAADTSHLSTLGVMINDTTANFTGNTSGSAIYTSFDGSTTSDGDILVKYTYYGDANLTGSVDGSDYSLIDNGYLNSLTGWYNGDFNYDGVINGSDYTLIDNAYNTQGASLASTIATATAQIAGTSAVPEPATLGILMVGGVGMLSRRRRR